MNGAFLWADTVITLLEY